MTKLGMFILGVGAVLFVLIGAAEAESRGDWIQIMCASNACIKEKLDSLSADRAAEAKLTTWGNFTYVWYRR